MTKAVVRIAQIATGDLLLSDTIKAGRELYHPRALQLAPNVPVLINHDEGRRIGRVVELDEWDDTDGRWVFARCVIDEVPEWLRGGSYSGSAASMAWVNLSHSQEMPGGWRRLNRGLITEVNILTPSPRARREAGEGRAPPALDRHCATKAFGRRSTADDPSVHTTRTQRGDPRSTRCHPSPTVRPGARRPVTNQTTRHASIPLSMGFLVGCKTLIPAVVFLPHRSIGSVKTL